jgi:hypothetical protein
MNDINSERIYYFASLWHNFDLWLEICTHSNNTVHVTPNTISGVGTVTTLGARPVVPQVATSSQRICGYISVMATLRFTHFLIKGTFVKNHRASSLNGEVFISYFRYTYLRGPVPTKRATIRLIRIKSRIALLRVLLVCIRS